MGLDTEVPHLDRTPPHRVTEALELAWTLYTQPALHRRGVSYLTDRGIDVGILERHTGRIEVGHSAERRDGLVRTMIARGFTPDELIDAGLAQRRPGSPLRDFYRQRVLIPVRKPDGQLCGFIGRNVGDSRYPKYKNPPRTVSYDKSVNLYQPLPGPTTAHGRVIIVEGTIDALAIAVAAIRSRLARSICPLT